MRVVVDTNVLVSGIMNPHGPPGRIVDAVLSRTLVVLHDDRILSEYREVLMRPIFGFQPADVEAVIGFIEFAGEQISSNVSTVVLPDPSDLPFLEVAMSGLADALISGNLKHFKPKKGHHNVRVCAPAEFLRELQ